MSLMDPDLEASQESLLRGDHAGVQTKEETKWLARCRGGQKWAEKK